MHKDHISNTTQTIPTGLSRSGLRRSSPPWTCEILSRRKSSLEHIPPNLPPLVLRFSISEINYSIRKWQPDRSMNIKHNATDRPPAFINLEMDRLLFFCNETYIRNETTTRSGLPKRQTPNHKRFRFDRIRQVLRLGSVEGCARFFFDFWGVERLRETTHAFPYPESFFFVGFDISAMGRCRRGSGFSKSVRFFWRNRDHNETRKWLFCCVNEIKRRVGGPDLLKSH